MMRQEDAKMLAGDMEGRNSRRFFEFYISDGSGCVVCETDSLYIESMEVRSYLLAVGSWMRKSKKKEGDFRGEPVQRTVKTSQIAESVHFQGRQMIWVNCLVAGYPQLSCTAALYTKPSQWFSNINTILSFSTIVEIKECVATDLNKVESIWW